MPLTRQFVLRQLRRLPGERGVRTDEHYAWMRCPFHAHGREHTGSLRLNLDRSTKFRLGSFHCFGCGEDGEWNDIARKLKLRRYKAAGDEEVVLEISDELRQNLLGESTERKLRAEAQFAPLWPRKTVWRKIPGWLVNDLDGRLINTPYGERLYLPVLVNKQITGGITCSLRDSSRGKYIYDKTPEIRRALYPFDYIKRKVRQRRRRGRKIIVFLVEGPRDALNLIRYGFLALSILGGKTIWHRAKADLLMSLDPDVVILAFDPDEVGEAVMQLAREALRGQVKLSKLKLNVEQHNGRKYKNDPGNLPEWRVLRLKQQIRWLEAR